MSIAVRVGANELLLESGILFMALVVLAVSASSASAATVKLTLLLNPLQPDCVGCTLSGPGTYKLFAQDVTATPTAPDYIRGFGIAAYGITVLNVNDVLHRSPRMTSAVVDPSNPDEVPDLAGFTNLRSATNQVVVGGTCPGAACGGFQIGASQDLITPTTHLIYGFGQTASSFATQGLTQSGGAVTQTRWGAKLLIAEGHWSPNNPNRFPGFGADVDSAVVLFASPNGPNVGGVLTVVVSEVVIAPEPTSIVLTGLAMFGLIGFARRRGR